MMMLALGLSACAGTAALNTFTPDSGYTVATNLPFKSGSSLRLDVYTPAESANAPVARVPMPNETSRCGVRSMDLTVTNSAVVWADTPSPAKMLR